MSNVAEKTESHAYKCGACPYLFHCTNPEECMVARIEAMHGDHIIHGNQGGRAVEDY